MPPVRNWPEISGWFTRKGMIDSTPWARRTCYSTVSLTRNGRRARCDCRRSWVRLQSGGFFTSRAGAAADGRRRRPRRGWPSCSACWKQDSLKWKKRFRRGNPVERLSDASIGTSAFSLGDGLHAKKIVAEASSTAGRRCSGRAMVEHLLGDYLRAQGFELSDSTIGRILRGAIFAATQRRCG